MNNMTQPLSFFENYADRLQKILLSSDWSNVSRLAQDVRQCWTSGHRVFLCGNGGSAGNATHLANDFLYGVARRTGGGIRVSSLAANPSVITCLANDVGYDSIFSEQLAVQGTAGDLLIALSGSGNSENIVRVLEQANRMGVQSCAVLGYSGGRAKALAGYAVHFPVEDMQISEDLQLVVGHMVMQWLHQNQPDREEG